MVAKVTVYSFEFTQYCFHLRDLKVIRQISLLLSLNALYIIQFSFKFALMPEDEKSENRTGAQFSLYTVISIKSFICPSSPSILLYSWEVGYTKKCNTCSLISWKYFGKILSLFYFTCG